MSVASAARRTPLRFVSGSTPFPSLPLRRPGVRETSCWGAARGRSVPEGGRLSLRGLFLAPAKGRRDTHATAQPVLRLEASRQQSHVSPISLEHSLYSAHGIAPVPSFREHSAPDPFVFAFRKRSLGGFPSCGIIDPHDMCSLRPDRDRSPDGAEGLCVGNVRVGELLKAFMEAHEQGRSLRPPE